MTHRWGFDLSTSAVRLMRREAGHWQEIASEPLDGDDMDARLRALVDQVPEPRLVDFFLPRDQILYTEIEVADPSAVITEIERGMEGRTPYALADLEIDWEISGQTARVAAIARETLAEAEAFADQCGLGVARFSTLAEADDFPREPDFGLGKAGAAALAEDTSPKAETAEETSSFATTRSDEIDTDTPETDPAPDPGPVEDPAGSDSGPVVRVDDAAPVMQVLNERDAPLDPGPALSQGPATPKVRTDLSLPETGGRAAASLTPPEPIDPYGRSERSHEDRMRQLRYGLAAVLTAAIAFVVWSILPDGTEISETIATEPAPIEATPPVTATLSDTPPEATTDLDARLAAPESTEQTRLTAFEAAPGTAAATSLPDVQAEAGRWPEPLTPLAPPPAAEDGDVVAMADLSIGPDESGLAFETPLPPVTRPGNVALPGVQSFASGVAPPPGEAPAYVIPAPPVVADLPEETEPEPPLETAETETDGPAIVATLPPARAPAQDTPAPEAETAEAVDEDQAAPEVALSEEPLPEDDLSLALTETTEAPTTEDSTEEIAEVPASGDETPEIAADPTTGDTTDEIAAAPEETPDAEPLATTPGDDTASALPQPTEFASALPDTPPAPRPTDFVLDLERETFGGRTRAELAGIRPPERPASAQRVAQDALGNAPPSALAVANSPDPRLRPASMATIVAAARTERQRQQLAALETANTSNAVRAALDDGGTATATTAEVEATDEAADEASNPRNSPRMAIPSTGDVARRATIQGAIRLNRINLVGVYGLASDRRALVRLPSGRYVKVKIGDRIDGGTIAAISEDALVYRKGGRNFELNMPQG